MTQKAFFHHNVRLRNFLRLAGCLGVIGTSAPNRAVAQGAFQEPPRGASAQKIPLQGATIQQAAIQQDAAHKTVTLADGRGDLKLRLNYDQGCVLDQLFVRGRQVLAPSGAATGVQVGGQWYTTRALRTSPKVAVEKGTLTVTGLTYGKPGEELREDWVFTVLNDRISWHITRTYPRELDLEDSAFPAWNFGSMATWTGGVLDTGGVVWNKYLEGPNATYGAHAGTVTLWNRATNDCLRVTSTLGQGLHSTARFSHQPQAIGAAFTFNSAVSREEQKPKHGFNRYLGDRQDLWASVKAHPGEQSAEFSLQALDYGRTYDRGTIQGLDGSSIRELMNTAGRYGVIDDKLVGGNGWRSGYICAHEQWFAQIGMVLNDPNYNANFAATLDNWRDHAVQPDGRVLSRWCYGSFDAMPGTYNAQGFYEAQWGYLLDSQTDYVLNVSEQFNLTNDLRWLQGQKQTCERALDYLLRREVGHTGLVAMKTDSRHEHKGSDWFDIVWASHRNAIVNAELFYAITLWAEREETLGDAPKAAAYRAFAARLKESFNRPVEEGGFWDAKNGWYVYWLDKDGSAHGSNLFTAVNFAAISYGLCDDKERQKLILDRIESEMQKENLFHWPTSFLPFAEDEVGGGNLPFPRYENGDIFMSWGEVAIRAYAQYDPKLALKYIKKALHRYEQDGLSFQRYNRRTQAGEGDDILSGNCMTVVGLYRDIYGLQPRANRLYLEPHLVPELNGTQLPYQLGGRRYTVDLQTTGSAITACGITLRQSSPFAVEALEDGIRYYPGGSNRWGLTAKPSQQQPRSQQPQNREGALLIHVQSWPTSGEGARAWSQVVTQGQAKTTYKTTYLAAHLRPGGAYLLKKGGKTSAKLRADLNGMLQFTVSAKGTAPQNLELSPAKT